MMWLALYMAAVLTYAAPVIATYLARVPTVSPVTTFVFFYLMEYGPHTLNLNLRKLSANVPDYAEARYLLAIAAANVLIAAGICVGRLLSQRRLTAGVVAALPRPMLVRDRSMLTVLLAVAALYALFFVVLDAMGPPRLLSILEYIAGRSSHAYNELRREMFAGTIVEQVMNYTRQTTSILLILLLCGAAARFRGPMRYAAGAIALVVFVTCSMQLNKFPLVYTLSCAAIVIYLLRTGNYYVPRPHLLWALLAIGLVILGMYGLYTIQYRAALSRGLLTQQDIQSLIFYRGTMAQADGLRLWFTEFPDRTPFQGIANIGLLAGLFDVPYFDVTKFIPIQYIKEEGTTFQAGFIGSGYASFGWAGVVGYAFLAGLIAITATFLVWRIRSADLRATFTAALCFNMYFLCSRELSAALLSGGVAPLMLFTLLARPPNATLTVRRNAASPLALPGPVSAE
jgi:hypothetical protein